ncbi:succinylglutamate desuccinylase [Alteromonas lipolytica]|uniref:Succinylglutamate desuccinylase n=1 Tax=Alteromonas lipolytica TaxID=1856405 RepID=A0A1E8FJI2_9ALTE|nr:succinylglutamate desuccinylase [Alteromonas lipolytica]OFI36090.1 succinylglutamate desuccinylase [Alteromonas lipolytica]GGF71045.1 succinylglutamate desuccinylase [Alteromonas lipolytica]
MDPLDLANGQFLHLSRFQPERLTSPKQWVLANGTAIELIAPGIIMAGPAQPGTKHIVLSCGIHGNETAPIEMCSDILDTILTGELALKHRVLFIFGNLPAMNIARRFVEENMNRLFSGAHKQGSNAECERARQLENVVTAFFADAREQDEKLHYDLHTAIRDSKNEKFVVMPYLEDGREHSAKQFGFLAACGVNTFLLSSAPTTTFSYFSSASCKARGFTVELGKVQPFGQNDMSRFEQARTALVALLSEVDFAPRVNLDSLLIYRVNQVINRQHEDFVLHFADDTPNFTDFRQGQLLASEPGAEYHAEFDGEAIVFPNARVALGQRALLTVIPTTVEKLDV